jgi:tRNA(Ile)-lysidine synthase
MQGFQIGGTSVVYGSEIRTMDSRKRRREFLIHDTRGMPRVGGAHKSKHSSKAPRDDTPISSAEAARLFAELAKLPAVVLAVSGGPDSTALLWLMSQWVRRRKSGPRLMAVTVDHGLRKQSRAEAIAVQKLADTFGVPHATLRWSGKKPSSGLPAAAREARYRLLADAARKAGASCVLTAHTRDDQVETFMMRLSRGSGLAGLASMSRYAFRDDLVIARPFQNVPKARLIATLARARISFADDPTNRDTTFTRPRWRQLLPQLAEEGIDQHNIGRLVLRLARANAALEAIVARAEHALLQRDGKRQTFDAAAFLSCPGEIRLRLLQRAIDRCGHEGPAELGKVESLLDELVAALSLRSVRAFRRTLAGALVGFSRGTVAIEPAPPRRMPRTRP